MPKVITDEKRIDELLTRGVGTIYPTSDALKEELIKGQQLKIYLGVDPTGPHLHLGHLTNLLTLKRFQELGHEIIFLIGDFTARIGDPTDKLAARQPLNEKQVSQNEKTFQAQAAKILNFSGKNPASLKRNSQWLSRMKFSDFIGLAQNFTVQQMLQRDMFQERTKSGKPIGLHEFFYPLMQGYDSVAMDVDLEIGGTDQTFNMLVGRDLVRIYKNKDKFVMTTKLLVNPKTGGKLMNKSEGGLINLDDSPNDIFGKVMALGDEAIIPVAECSTALPLDEIERLKRLVLTKPRDAKIAVAYAVAETIYGALEAKNARETFIKQFAKKQRPEEIPVVVISKKEIILTDLLVKIKLTSSKSEARRLIGQGGVKVNDVKKTDPNESISLSKNVLIQVGPRRFLRVRS